MTDNSPQKRKGSILAALVVLVLSLSACNAQASSMTGEMEPAPVVPAGTAYLDGQEIRFIHTEASDADVAGLLSEMMKSPVLVVPELAQAPDALLATVYVFKNGVAGMGPLGFQPDVFDNPPGTPGYRPLRKITFVTWQDAGKAREIKSLADLQVAEQAGELTLEVSNVVVNMPFITWPGGSR